MHSVASSLRKVAWFHPWVSSSFCCVHQLHEIGWPGEYLKWKLNCTGTESEVPPWFISLWLNQAGWGENTPKKCHDCQVGKRHESWINAINSEVASLFQIVVSLLWGRCLWNINRSQPSNICIPSHPSSITICKSAYFKGRFPKEHPFVSPLSPVRLEWVGLVFVHFSSDSVAMVRICKSLCLRCGRLIFVLRFSCPV